MRYFVGLAATLALVAPTLGGCSGDGGETYAWCGVDSPNWRHEDVMAVSFPDPLIGTVVGGIGRTTDGGLTWTVQESPAEYESYSDVVFTDVNTGTIVGGFGTILRTTDGGENWRAQDSGTQAALEGVAFADENTGLVVGSEGTILRTTDGGATWVAQDSGTDVTLRGVWLSDVNTATAVGDVGTVLRTSDGGASWVPRDSGTDAPLNAVSFGSLESGVVVGGNGMVLRTTDGGQTWSQSHDFSPASLNDVWFADADVGTIVGESGTILRTTDGGSTWTQELNDAVYYHWDQSLVDPIPIRKTLYGVSMADADNGVAVGEFYGVLRRTTVSDTYKVCDSWCVKSNECYPEGALNCEIDCLCNLRYSYDISPECERAIAESQRCFSALTCEQIEAYFDDPDNHPCTAAEDQIDMVCDPDEPAL